MVSTGNQLLIDVADLAVDRLGEPAVVSPMAGMLRGRASSPHYVHESDRVLLDDTAAMAVARKCAASELPSLEPGGPREHIYFDPGRTRVGIVTCGGLCPGLNNVIRGLVLGLAESYGVTDVVGFRNGYQGLIGDDEPVWMSHGDVITAIPLGFEVIATSSGSPFAAIANEQRRIYGLQFHAEVAHTPRGATMLRNFTHHIAGFKGDWTMASFRKEMVAKIRAQVGEQKVICGLSGGVDSSVAAVLIHEAIGEQLTCVFVDTGLLRLNEAEQVVSLFRNHYNIPLVHVDASKEFLGALAGVSDASTCTSGML